MNRNHTPLSYFFSPNSQYQVIGLTRAVAFAFLSLIFTQFAMAQPAALASWDFLGDTWDISQQGTRLDGAKENYSRASADGHAYIRILDETQGGLLKLTPNMPKVFSLACWFRIPSEVRSEGGKLFWTSDNSLQVNLSPSAISFRTMVKGANQAASDHILLAEFQGTDVESYRLWSDGNWHLLVIQYNPATGQKSIWLDAKQAPSWNVVVPEKGQLCSPRNQSCVQALRFSTNANVGNHFQGDISGLSVYDRYLTPPNISQLAARRVVTSRAIPSEVPKNTSGTDPREFPKAPVAMSAIEQLQSFPTARFLPGHTLLPLYNWISPAYMAGYKLQIQRMDQAVDAYGKLQTEMVTNWHYYLTLENSRRAIDMQKSKGPTFGQAFVDLANQNPTWPLAITTFWAQIRPNEFGGTGSRPNIRSKDLASTYYLQDAQGRFLDRSGNIVAKPIHLRPSVQTDLWEKDGELQKQYLDIVLSKLNRNVDIINENGEVHPLPIGQDALSKDPTVVADHARSPYQDWEDYASAWKTDLRVAYRDGFLSHPKLRNTTFTWYAIDGGPYSLDRFQWDIARKAMTPINGQYYSTPNFYVRWPENWERWKGPWRGWEWISISRKVEIEAGDKLFSPFVAAGWDKIPENNVRPSQWLGLLKCLGTVGAEFYYVGVFHEKNISQFPLPENYTWQAAMPAYAQAVTSRYEEILRNGDLLTGTDGRAVTEIDAQDPNILFTVRKHQNKPEYILAGTLQPRSNIKGNVEDQATARVTINGRDMKFTVRRQGSVYWLNLNNPANPVLVQLDAWHETGHPSWWSENFSFQAENPDFMQDCGLKTDPVSDSDFTQFKSYLASESAQACAKYHFQPRTRSSYRLQTITRGQGTSGTISVLLDGKKIGEIPVKASANWQSHTLQSPILKNLPANALYLLTFDFSGTNLLLDQFVLEKIQ
ncbi:MAG: LamG domain-containing protein [Bacteroidia bacterium]|nr:LamG domain-containing protein [Bacteroidia bacterium]